MRIKFLSGRTCILLWILYGNMVDFSFIVSLYVSDLPNVTISTICGPVSDRVYFVFGSLVLLPYSDLMYQSCTVISSITVLRTRTLEDQQQAGCLIFGTFMVLPAYLVLYSCIPVGLSPFVLEEEGGGGGGGWGPCLLDASV